MIDTAFSCGMTLRPKNSREPVLVIGERLLETTPLNDLMADWFALTYVLNSLNRSVGMPDPYPFALSPAVVEKLAFIHRLIFMHCQSEKATASAPAALGKRTAM